MFVCCTAAGLTLNLLDHPTIQTPTQLFFFIISAAVAAATNESPFISVTGTGLVGLSCRGRDPTCAAWQQNVIESSTAQPATIDSGAQYGVFIQSVSHNPGYNVSIVYLPWWDGAPQEVDELPYRVFRAPAADLDVVCPALCATYVNILSSTGDTTVVVHNATHLGGKSASRCRTDTRPWVCSGQYFDAWVYRGTNGTSCINGCHEYDVVCMDGVQTSLDCLAGADESIADESIADESIAWWKALIGAIFNLGVLALCIYGCVMCCEDSPESPEPATYRPERLERATYSQSESWVRNGRIVHGRVHYYLDTGEEAYRTV